MKEIAETWEHDVLFEEQPAFERVADGVFQVGSRRSTGSSSACPA
ncbi:MAG: hypothetical protein ACRD29_04615 [Acidimicrobiales bacterium]